MLLTSLILALSLTVASETNTPAKNYKLDVSGTSKEVQAGKSGTLKLSIKPAEGYKVSAEAPMKIGLEAEGLELAKKLLGHQDAKDKKSTAPEFDVSFGATTAGEKSIIVDASFFVCNEKLCERKTEKVTVPVSVRP